MRTTFLTALAAVLAVTAVATDASAKSRKHIYTYAQQDYSSPLTVNRRSWLDPGTAVSHGSQQAYMSASTQFAKSQDRIFGADRYGNDVMVGQPYVPGRSVPLVEFSTYPDGSSTVDNTIGYQNYYFNPTPPEAPRAYQQTYDIGDVSPLSP